MSNSSWRKRIAPSAWSKQVVCTDASFSSQPPSEEQMNTEAQVLPSDTVMSRLLARWSFPVTMVVLTGIGIVAMQRGYSPLVTLTVLSIASFLIVIVLEQINPHSAYWEKPQGDVVTDLLHMVISGALIPPATGVVWRVLMAGWAASLSAALGMGLWPDQWPMVAQVTLALVIAELGQYWWHRLAHEKDFLWRFHSTHHSPWPALLLEHRDAFTRSTCLSPIRPRSCLWSCSVQALT